VESTEARVIRRYQNRKLYDTKDSRYVTLEDIAVMIKNGIDIVVIDNKTKKDLTSLTLTQIIFEEEKKDQSILPLAALKRIIQSGSESLQDLVGRLIAPGMTSIQQARQEVEKVVDKLARRGKIPEDERQSITSKFYADTQKSMEEMSRRIEENVKNFFDRTRAVTQLTEKLKKLEKEVKELEKTVRKNREPKSDA
jgi:polyhydroxyalkanoate synthesis repressor PhaR